MEKLRHPGLIPAGAPVSFENFAACFDEDWNVSACDALFRNAEDFLPGSLSLCLKFWEDVVLVNHPLKVDILLWLKYGVKVEYFLSDFSSGTYNGVHINSRLPQFYRERNHVSPEFQEWVTLEIQQLVKSNVLLKWDPDTMGSPSPLIIAPLLVEPSKPRLIYDARYLNCFLTLPSVEMWGLGKIPSCCWEGMYFITVDHKSGYFHVPLHPSSWTYFGVEWLGEVYCYVTLTFGWSPSAFIYCTLTGACSSCVRRISASPVIDWVDDTLTGTSLAHRSSSPEVQFKSANRSAFVIAMVLYFAGYFVNIPKSNFFPTRVIQILGLIVDSSKSMFFVPPGKIRKLLLSITKVIEDGFVSTAELESIVGKCRNMALAVPSAILYTRVQYAALATALAQGPSHKWSRSHGRIILSADLREELSFWLNLDSALMNGSHWLNPAHLCLFLENFLAHADSSSRRWGGIVLSSEFSFRTAEDFGEENIYLHINVKEAFALWQLLCNFLPLHRDAVRHKKLLIHTDSMVLFYIFHAQGSSVNLDITAILKKIFWLQIEFECFIVVKWIPSADNLADPLTRLPILEDLRLKRSVFLSLWKQFGPFSMDLMASSSNSQVTPQGVQLPYFSQYCVQGCSAVDVFAQDLSPQRFPSGIPYCFPPFAMIDLFLSFLQYSAGSCLVILPENFGIWYPKFRVGVKKVVRLSEANSKGVLLTFKANSFRPFVSKYAMIAACIDFS